MAEIQFEVECDRTNPGESVFIVGSAPELGTWSVEKGVRCGTSSGKFPVWMQAVTMKTTGKLEFKIVIAKDGGAGARWEDGDNKSLEVGAQQEQSIVRCSFGNNELAVSKHVDSHPDVAPTTTTETPLEASKTASNGYASANTSGTPKRLHRFDSQELPLAVHPDTSSAPLTRGKSRHMVTNASGNIDIDMSRTASMMLVNFDDLAEEADKQEKKLNDLEAGREKLSAQQMRMQSRDLLKEMKGITDFADPSDTIMLQGFNWESHKAGKGDWWGILAANAETLSDAGITDVWFPPCSASVAPQGYLPSQLFNMDGSAYGKKASLQECLKKMHEVGIRGVADIVINHRCGDKQDSQGRWNVFTSTGIEHRESMKGVADWQGWAVTLGDKFSDGSGERGPGQYDGKFDAAPDIDHGNMKVRNSLKTWLRWLRLEIGFDAWRFDFVKGYGAEFVGWYCEKSEPAWAVGELWLDMHYDGDGLCYDQDKHRQDTINWINGTQKRSTAFDFTTKGILQEACRNCQYWRLKDSNGKPPGLLGWMPSHAVTFLDNHDTGSTQAHWPFPNDKVMVGYAYILTHPGIPCIFWDHLMDWGDDVQNKIKELVRLRRESGISVNAKVNIMCAEDNFYLAEIGEPAALRVALGPRGGGEGDGGYWKHGAAGSDYRVWIKK